MRREGTEKLDVKEGFKEILEKYLCGERPGVA